MFCFVKNVWLTNRKKSYLSDFLDHTDSSTGKGLQFLWGIKQAHLGEGSGKQWIEKEIEKEGEKEEAPTATGESSRNKQRQRQSYEAGRCARPCL